ncbi:Uncharacterized protein APZ42_015129 [Daphnia magna]|uniref:Uncharacterized protein n=1 Tax=Daphnia magna TaxID=35525 RepID=A0A0N8CMD6_9CRUS|nr:Uncharacterized protein APZ42_015129 [Daphnia magna]
MQLRRFQGNKLIDRRERGVGHKSCVRIHFPEYAPVSFLLLNPTNSENQAPFLLVDPSQKQQNDYLQ